MTTKRVRAKASTPVAEDTATPLKVAIFPFFRGPDDGDGGIRRVWEAQMKWLPRLGIDITDDIDGADIVATHATSHPNVPISKPWVTHSHGMYYSDWEWDFKWYHTANRELIDVMRRADVVTAPSEWVANSIRRAMWIKPHILYHGVDPDDWTPPSTPDATYVLWNKTRVDPVCDPTVVNEIATRMTDIKFITTFGNKTANVGVTGKLPYPEAKTLIVNAGIYLATALETFGIGTIEALAAGVPVVGWRWGGQTEIIRHMETGYLARPGDLDDLAAGIRWAIANRETISPACTTDVRRRWTWEIAIARYADLYRSEVAKSRDRFSTTTPRTSVIIPSYRLSTLLPQTLESVINQTDPDWEAIVIDDASPDDGDTRKVVDAYSTKDDRIKYIRNDRNLYLAGTLNVGAGASRGRYILPLDSDNMIAPATLEILAGALDRNRGIDIAYGGVRFVKEDGVTPDDTVGSNDGISGWPEDFSFAEQMRRHNQIPSTSLYRREVHSDTGGYRRRYRTAEDADFWTRVASVGKVPMKVTPEVTLIYRNRQDSMSRTNIATDWTAGFPWAKDMGLTPWAVPVSPPERINFGLSWPVNSYTRPTVAIVIPVGAGHEDIVIDAIDSVVAQTEQSWECVVVNDTGKPLPWMPSWVKVIDTIIAGSGPGAARNIGIQATRAPFILPLDADDILAPIAIASFLAAHRRYGGVIYSQWWDDNADTVTIYDPPDYDAKLLLSKGCIHAVTALYSREDLNKVGGGFDPNLSHWEDWDLQIALAAKGICSIKVPLPLWTYRKQTGARREDNMANFEQGKASMLAKWSKYWEGGEELMACKSCGGRRYGEIEAQQQQQQQLDGGSNGMMAAKSMAGSVVMIEYIGTAGTFNVTGKPSGRTYRFGTDDGHRYQYVDRSDAPYILSMTNMFKLVEEVVAVV